MTGGPEDTGGPEYHRGEQRRRVPRSAWVVLAVAVVVLAGFLIARPYWFGGDPDSLHVPDDRHFTTSLAGLGDPDGVQLTDDSPSTAFTASLPVDAGPGETRLQLHGSTQVADHSTVFLTVAVDGQQVHKQSLSVGDNALDETVPVPTGLVIDGTVRVRVSVQGTMHGDICMPDHSAGMLVHLDPGTLLESALDEPVRTVRDAVASWDHDITVVLADHNDPWRTTAAQSGIALTQQGYAVTFADTMPGPGDGDVLLVGPRGALDDHGWTGPDSDGDAIVAGTVDDAAAIAVVEPHGEAVAALLSTPALAIADAATNDPRAAAVAGFADGEARLDRLGADTAEQQITENHRWRAGYSIPDLPGGRPPTGVRVAFQLPASPADLTWVMNVKLNDRLIDSQPLQHTTDPVTVALPAEVHRVSNDLVISVQRDRNIGGCGIRITSYPIQLLDDSALVMGDAVGAGLAGVPTALEPGFAVYAPGVSPEDTGAILTAVVPAIAAFTPARYTPDVHWGSAPEPGRPFLLIGADPEVNTRVHLQDGRFVSGTGPTAVDLTASTGGVLTQCAAGPGDSAGVAVQSMGDAGPEPTPDFGQECVQVTTPGGEFALDADGAMISTGTPRTATPR